MSDGKISIDSSMFCFYLIKILFYIQYKVINSNIVFLFGD